MENKNGESSISIALKLTVICFISALLLTLINFVTEPIIKNNNMMMEYGFNSELMPGGVKFVKKDFKALSEEEKKTLYYYEVKDGADNNSGFIVVSGSSGYKYSEKVRIITAFDNDLKIINLKIMDNNENGISFGRITEKKDFKKIFVNTNTGSNPLPTEAQMLSKENKDSIAGATIYFNGIADTIKTDVSLLKNEIKK
jgi:Na+-translocating ferredoxin:NAD+ oxidoreductase RnfG subunit